MAAKKSTAKSVSRRVHCSIDALPAELQTAIERMILNREWPSDFKGHYNGFPRYIDAIQYCKGKGYIIKESAMGRFGIRMQKVHHNKTAPTKKIEHEAVAGGPLIVINLFLEPTGSTRQKKKRISR